MAYVVRSADGRQESLCHDADAAAQKILELGKTMPVHWRTNRGNHRELLADELADLRSAVTYHREARTRLAARPAVQAVPLG